jgi:hypothetical protein
MRWEWRVGEFTVLAGPFQLGVGYGPGGIALSVFWLWARRRKKTPALRVVKEDR